MDVDDYTQPLESVVHQERMAVYPVPLKLKDRQELFERWCKLNPQALRQIELTALAIDQRGLRVSTKPNREAALRRHVRACGRAVPRRKRA